MSIESRPPPPQFVAKLRRVLGGQAGWSGFAFQLVFVAVLIFVGYEIVANARANLQSQRIASGFGFLNNTAGFDISQTLIRTRDPTPISACSWSACSTRCWSR